MKILNQKNLLDMNETQLLRQWNVLAKWVARFNEIDGPRVGDFVQMPDGDFRRFCHDWGKEIQITPSEHCGSFNIDGGHCDYSGSLEPSIEKRFLRFSHSFKLGRVWFFKDAIPAGHSGIDAEIPCRVFYYEPEETKA